MTHAPASVVVSLVSSRHAEPTAQPADEQSRRVTFVATSEFPPAPKRMFSALAAEVKPVPVVGCLTHLSHGCPGFTDRTAVMKITPQTLGTVLGNLQIVIPLFQRRYCWTEKQGASWWRDLRNLMKKGGWNSSHGTGKIVVMQHKSDDVSQMVCIDGQQRLTTTMLLIAAIRDAAAAVAPNDSAAFAALQSRLTSLLHVADATCRLQPSYIDRASFFSLLGYGDHLPPNTPTSVNPSLVSMKALFDQRVSEMLRSCASCDEMVGALAQVLVQCGRCFEQLPAHVLHFRSQRIPHATSGNFFRERSRN